MNRAVSLSFVLEIGMEGQLFNFQAYLASKCPGEQFEISVLTGGLVNVTVRATRIGPSLDSSPFSLAEASSFIMKYAPGYIASIGEEAPFSEFRQANFVSCLCAEGRQSKHKLYSYSQLRLLLMDYSESIEAFVYHDYFFTIRDHIS